MIPQLTIEVAEIMILANYVRDCSFVRMAPNRNDIAGRGWFPLNHNLLLNTQPPYTITTKEKYKESTFGISTPYHKTTNYVVINKSAPTYETQILVVETPKIQQ